MVTAIYLVAMAALGLHLWHGVWSALQTLGCTNTARPTQRAPDGMLLAVVIAGGFSLSPIFTLVGVIS